VTSPVLFFRLGLRDFTATRLLPARGGAVPFLFTAFAMVRIPPIENANEITPISPIINVEVSRAVFLERALRKNYDRRRTNSRV
jgi:hypothetical protein